MHDMNFLYNPLVFLICSIVANTINIFNNRRRYLSGCACSYSKEFKSIVIILIISTLYALSVCVIVAMISKNFAVIFFEPPFLEEKINLFLFTCLSCSVIFFDKLNLFLNTRIMQYIERKLHLTNTNDENKSGS